MLNRRKQDGREGRKVGVGKRKREWGRGRGNGEEEEMEREELLWLGSQEEPTLGLTFFVLLSLDGEHF